MGETVVYEVPIPALGGPRAAPIDNEPHHQGKLSRSIFEELILERGLQIGEPCHGRRAGRADLGPGLGDGDAKIRGDALGNIGFDVDLLTRGRAMNLCPFFEGLIVGF